MGKRNKTAQPSTNGSPDPKLVCGIGVVVIGCLLAYRSAGGDGNTKETAVDSPEGWRVEEDVGVPKNVHGKSTAQYPLLPRHESEEMTRAMEQHDTGDLEKAIYTAEVALAASLRLPVGELFALTSKSSRGDSGDALDRILPLVEARAEEGDLDLTAWATLLYFHHFLDSSGKKIHEIDAILNDATPRGWGLLMIGVEMLTVVLDMKTDSETALTMHALVKSGMPTDRQQYWAAIERRGPLVGLFNLTMQAMEQRYLTNADLVGDVSDVDAQYFMSLLSVASHNQILVMKLLISTSSVTALDWIGDSCGVPGLSQISSNRETVTTAIGRNLVTQCVVNQKVLRESLERYIKDMLRPRPEWSVVHEAAAFGQPTLMKYALIVEPNVLTAHKVSPLHVAASNGWAELIPQLVEVGYDPELKNAEGWSAIDIACKQQWTHAELLEAFGEEGEAQYCDVEMALPKRGFKYVGPGGGWSKVRGAQLEPDCDVDVREKLSAAEFLKEYVAVRRPVLLRKVQRGRAWDALRDRWSRMKISKNHGDVKFNTSTIPYGKQFDESAEEMEMGIAQYLEYMAKLYAKEGARNANGSGAAAAAAAAAANANKEGRAADAGGSGGDATKEEAGAGASLPQYIFSSLSSHLSSDSSLHQTILGMDPSFVDWTRMLKNSPQFYLGSAGTGAPVHFHTHAYNVLVHGRKKWVLLPPRHSLYATQHIQKWLQGPEYTALRDSGTAIECVQEPGDVLYVPTSWAHGVLNLAESVGYAMEFAFSDGFAGDNFASKNDELGQTKEKTGKRTEVVLTLSSESIESLKTILLEDFDDKCARCSTKQDYIDRIKMLNQERKLQAGSGNPKKRQ